jgi:hypothetical protein
MNSFYYIDLDSKPLKVEEYDKEALQEDLEYFKVSNAFYLNDPDWKVFNSKEKADTWLLKYVKVLNSLDNKKICKSRELPAMLYKRRYIVQALLGEKTFTERHYLKNWNNGDLFNFHDQTYFLTVKLNKIEKVSNNGFRYYYALI